MDFVRVTVRTDIVGKSGKPHTKRLSYSCGQMQTPLPVPVTPPLCMQDGDTALIKAIVSENPAMVKLLIECGANKDRQNKVNRTRVSGILFASIWRGCYGGMIRALVK